jgi:glycosyltransferase involved in cell wall biosynthesis
MNASGRWKVVSLELSQPMPELCCEPGYDGVRVIFFWDGLALGHQRYAADQLPLSPHHLANGAAQAIVAATGDRLLPEGFRSALPGLAEASLEDPEDALRKLLAIDQPMQRLSATDRPVVEPELRVSVAICTRERPAELARCLTSVLASSEAPYEIIVVDNAPSSGSTREVVNQFAGVRYQCEPQQGLSAARNTALAVANGDVVAFADDDVTVHSDWVWRIRRSFEDPKVMLLTGLVLPGELQTPAQLMFEESFHFFHQGYRRRCFDATYFAALRNKSVPVWDIGAGANMAIRREAFKLGYCFDIRLGPGVFGGCGEDSEYCYRLLAEGWSCVYEPSACVYHFHRRELHALRRHVRQYMQGHVAALLLQFMKYRHVGNLRRLFLELPAEYLVLFLRLIVTGFALDNRILFSGVLGCFSGLCFPMVRKEAQTSLR